MLLPAPLQLEDGGQCTIYELVDINLGTEDDTHPTFVSASLTTRARKLRRIHDRVLGLLRVVI